MGKATLDLPDPLEQPTSGAPGNASADDLLAQLAGEEIDRLLSEADVYPDEPVDEPLPRMTAAPPTAKPPAASSSGVRPAADVPPAEKPTDVTVAPALAPIDVAAGVTDTDLSNQLDELFNNLTESVLRPGDESKADEAAAAERQTAARADRGADEGAAPLQPTFAEVSNAELGTSIAERSALDLESDPAELVLPMGSAEAPGEDEEQPLPLWLRPLEWLNAPLESCPEAWRQAIGKIALLTSFNALAVLVYVVFFRRH